MKSLLLKDQQLKFNIEDKNFAFFNILLVASLFHILFIDNNCSNKKGIAEGILFSSVMFYLSYIDKFVMLPHS